MLEGDDVLSLGGARVKDLGEATDLERLALLHHLLICSNVPLRWHGEPRVRLLDALKSHDFLVKVLDLGLNFLERLRVGSLAIPLEEGDVTITERDSLIVLHHLVFLFLLCVVLSNLLAAGGVDLLLFFLL